MTKAKKYQSAARTRRSDWRIAIKRSVIKALAEGAEKEARKAVERAKGFGARLRRTSLPQCEEFIPASENAAPGLPKHGHRLYALFGLANVAIGARRPRRSKVRTRRNRLANG